tara:strand:- start:452 stop:646 length:195 start_codon:yes stop_codon:yes gene_type:complete
VTTVAGGAVRSEVAGFNVDQKLNWLKVKPAGNEYIMSTLGPAISIISGSVTPGSTAPDVNLNFT